MAFNIQLLMQHIFNSVYNIYIYIYSPHMTLFTFTLVCVHIYLMISAGA